MIHKEINLCGKPVTLGYCYATEIAFKDLSGQDLTDFAMEAVTAFQKERMPDVKKTIYLILSAMLAYYQDDEQLPVRDTDMMHEATPPEIGTALGTIIALRAQFYHVADDEPKDKPAAEGAEGKN